VLRVQIQVDGMPGAIEIVQSAGYRELDDAAIEAVRAAQFVPARRDGILVSSWVEVPVTFRLNHG
jgi:protein TonB